MNPIHFCLWVVISFPAVSQQPKWPLRYYSRPLTGKKSDHVDMLELVTAI